MTIKRPRFKKSRDTGYSPKWVGCIACGHEYVIEPYVGAPECPVCDSREYEQVDCYPLLSIRDDYDDYR